MLGLTLNLISLLWNQTLVYLFSPMSQLFVLFSFSFHKKCGPFYLFVTRECRTPFTHVSIQLQRMIIPLLSFTNECAWYRTKKKTRYKHMSFSKGGCFI